MKRILGFDVSSSTVGWCVLDIDEVSNDITHVTMQYLKPSKKGNIIDRLIDTRNEVSDIMNTWKPDYIGIEDLIKFMPKSTATAVVMLTTFNRMICLSAYDYLKEQPALFNVLTIRHGLKTSKILPKKADMPALVAKHLNIAFPYEYNKKGKPKDENEDMADGTAVALYYAFLLTGRIKSKGKKK
jgi:Holliday junction resolvasome RuvABC endonuclease subunit